MAEQSSRDVVDQTLSGGEPSPSDVPASTNDKPSAGGDEGKTEHIAMNTTSNDETPNGHGTTNTFDSQGEGAGSDKDTGSRTTGAGLVATRVLELNGLASASDGGGDDTASQGGSESDASRTDSRNHTRNGSVKKPSSFKPVSFAKQKFSVPKVPGAPAPPKAPEKTPSTSTTPLGTPQPSSRPRLVAKTTLGMRDSLSKNGAGGANSSGSGPDPNQVWNKNRPVAPPPPKHLTDEELKQQYGIHMTSRIQEDGAVTSEAKWADIDDDEDDWAPETIEWTDGTKVNLTHGHADPPPVPSQPVQSLPEPKEAPKEAQAQVQAQAPKEAPVAPKVQAAPKLTTSVGPNPTILKLGANAERQARTAGASLKGANDKVPSSSTSPAPPSKSPWAPLPPVERVSPVNGPMAPPQQQRMPVRHHPHRDDGLHAPPKEIAADDFNRTWKEFQSGAPRELFNSRSGQYEPVAETRRPSWRHDQHPHPRAPAVLQRANDHPSGPAEPSAAFQTHRSSHQDGMGWGGRRRTSSNVSGGSGGFGRRMSFGRHDAPPRMNDGRRGSQTIIDPALMGPEQHHHQYHGKEEISHPPGPNGTTVRSADQVPVEAPLETQPAVPPPEDPVVLQERIMKEKRLEARQRRIEQEEKEEAAKKERIRQRLEAMGPAPEKKAPESRTPPAPPSQLSPQPHSHPHPHSSPHTSHQSTHPISPPPKPPVPEPTGAPKQYGMMKVHHPDSVKKLVGAHDRPSDGHKHLTRRVSSPNQETPTPREPLAPNSPVKSNGQPEERWQQNNLKVSTSPWSHPSITTTSPTVKNPWKPLGSDRTTTLGNGIFDQPLGFSSRENSLRQLGFDQAAMAGPPNFVAAAPEQAACLPSPEARHTSFDPLHPIGRPGPIGPPNAQQPRAVNAWKSFAENAGESERQDQKNFMEHFHKTHQKGEHVTAPSTFNETWKQIKSNDEGRRVVSSVTRTVVGKKEEATSEPGVRPLSNPLTVAAPVDGLPSSDLNRSGPPPARSSRFFPSATEQQPKRQVVERERSGSPSPPPPEEVSSHPVYFGDSSRPHVHLPIPKPVVKLPPKVVSAPAPPPTFASMAAAPPRNAMPRTSTAISWQEKINSLFKSEPNKNVLAVTPATKEALPVHTAAVSVSIPRTKLGSQKGDGDIAVEQVERQDEMFEDREPGSLPAVRVPTMAPPNSWGPLPPLRQLRKNIRQVYAQSIPAFVVGQTDRDNHGNMRATVLLPGGFEPVVFLVPRKPGPHRPRNNNNNRPRKGNSKPGEAPRTKFEKPTSNTGSRQQSSKPSWGPTSH
ncbi:unnamed protein product [Penicillium salamii]|nr:unnamed protein product [Penicillium salamii]